MSGGLAVAIYVNVLLSSAVAVALADGNYQRTKDGKTVVWNDNPRPGDAAAWSGDRDRDGYAAGFGTLTWYSIGNGTEPKQTLYAYYFGNMVRGKFHGPVNGHSKGVTNHALFIDGKRTGRWAAGPVPSWRVPARTNEIAEPEEPKAIPEITPAEFHPPPPSYAVANAQRRPVPNYEALREHSPSAGAVPDVPAEGPSSPDKRPVAPPVETKPPKLDIDNSLRSLTGPPAGLRPSSERASGERNQAGSGLANQHLDKPEVIDLATAEARKHGYDLSRYSRSEPEFDSIDHTWSLAYEVKAKEAETKSPRRFTIAIDDKTKRIAIVANH